MEKFRRDSANQGVQKQGYEDTIKPQCRNSQHRIKQSGKGAAGVETKRVKDVIV